MNRTQRLEALRERVKGQLPELAQQLGVTARVLRWTLKKDNNPDLVARVADAVIQQDATQNRQSKNLFTPLLHV